MSLPCAAARLAPPLGLAAIWLATHRYSGIQHDGLYYAGQALVRADPQAFRHDLFFAFGSQDDYSLFSPLYSAISSRLGLGYAALLMLAAGHLAWAVAAWALARRWVAGRALWLGLALLFALPGHYGSRLDTANDILRYAEGFLTARSWAEPLVLAALAACLAGRRALAFAGVAGAMLCHPLMGATGALFLAAFYLRPNAIGIAAASALALATALLLPAMDGAWLAEVRLRARYLFLDEWTASELLAPLAWTGILAAAADSSNDMRRACHALILAALAGMGLAVLGTLTGAALLLQTQPWRVLWLLQVGGLFALAALAQARWQSSPADRLLVAGFAAAALTADSIGGPLALVLAWLGRSAWLRGPPDVPAWLRWLAGLALGFVFLAKAAAILQEFALFAPRLDPRSLLPAGDLASLFQGAAWLLLPAAMALLLTLRDRVPVVALAVALLATGTAAAGWYHAGDPLQRSYFARVPERPFGNLISRTETVYWQNNPTHAWFLLRQGNYGSRLQAVSGVFFREAAMESRRRLDRLSAFGSNDADPLPGNPPHPPTAEGLRRLCADPVLDTVIVATPIAGIAAREWFDPLRNAPWHLYRCAELGNAERARP